MNAGSKITCLNVSWMPGRPDFFIGRGGDYGDVVIWIGWLWISWNWK